MQVFLVKISAKECQMFFLCAQFVLDNCGIICYIL